MALTNYYKKIRSIMTDDLVAGDDFAQFVSEKTFTLSMSTIDETSLAVFVNGTQIYNVSGSPKYSYANGKVTLDEDYDPQAGALLEFQYNGYQRYTDFEIRQYILSSIIRLCMKQYQTFVLRDDDTIFPTPTENDENLICFVASILMEGNVAVYKTGEIEIQFGKEEDNEVRIKKLLALWKKSYGVVDYLKMRYNVKPLDDGYSNLH